MTSWEYMEATDGKLSKLWRGRAESMPHVIADGSAVFSPRYLMGNTQTRQTNRRLDISRLYWGRARSFYIPVNII